MRALFFITLICALFLLNACGSSSMQSDIDIKDDNVDTNGVNGNVDTTDDNNSPPPDSSSCANNPSPFISVWNIPAGKDDRRITLPIVPYNDEIYDFTVDWGDGSATERISNASDTVASTKASHLYPEDSVAREYTITIEGNVGKSWSMHRAFEQEEANDATDDNGSMSNSRDKLLKVNDLGSVRWQSFHGAFANAKKLTEFTGGCTDEVVDMSLTFNSASAANPDVSAWDTSNVTNMSAMFWDAITANPDVSAWDTSSVTNMHGMFVNPQSANPDVSAWDTSSVTDMSYMFRGTLMATSAANPDVSAWDTSSVTNMGSMFRSNASANPDVSAWDTSSVTHMSYMFMGATVANPDVSAWDTSSVIDMSYMFGNAQNANPDVSTWNFSNVDVIRQFFYHSELEGSEPAFYTNLTVESYSNFLMQLHSQLKDTTIHLGSSKNPIIRAHKIQYYPGPAAAAREHLISKHKFYFDDGGQAPD